LLPIQIGQCTWGDEPYPYPYPYRSRSSSQRSGIDDSWDRRGLDYDSYFNDRDYYPTNDYGDALYGDYYENDGDDYTNNFDYSNEEEPYTSMPKLGASSMASASKPTAVVTTPTAADETSKPVHS
jgi:hypothetical protein